MVKKLSNLVIPALNKCSLSLGDETDHPTCSWDFLAAGISYSGPSALLQLIEILTFLP